MFPCLRDDAPAVLSDSIHKIDIISGVGLTRREQMEGSKQFLIASHNRVRCSLGYHPISQSRNALASHHSIVPPSNNPATLGPLI